MASQNKIKKFKNSYCCYGALKNKKLKLKRTMFYKASQRKDLNSNIKKEHIMDFNKIRSKVEFPKDWNEFWKALEVVYESGKEDTTYKLQCCANCKLNCFGRQCSKGQSGECKDYSCWEIHDSDCVEM